MATAKLTITLEREQLQTIRKLVARGAAWGATLDLALQQTGGPLTNAERKWADSILRGRRKRRV